MTLYQHFSKPLYRKLEKADNLAFAAFIIILMMLLIVVAIVVWPLLVIWALNTAFGFTIPYTLKMWAAVLLLLHAVKAHSQTETEKQSS